MKLSRYAQNASFTRPFLLLVASFSVAPSAARAVAAERQLGQVRMGIHLVHADGSDAQPLALVGDRFHHGSPAWSPDGKQLAFDAYRSGFQEPALFLCDADGSNLRELTSGAYPRWSPDGKRLVFYSGLASGSNSEIFLVGADGANRRLLTRGTFPDWSPDGKTIVFGRSEGERGIWAIGPDSGGLRQIAATEGDVLGPVWSPDGMRIAFAQAKGSEANLYLIDAQGGAEQQLTAGDGHDFFANWSPDGKHIAFVRYDQNLREADVVVIDADGSNLRRVTEAAGYQIDPAWSPDGMWIVYGAEK